MRVERQRELLLLIAQHGHYFYEPDSDRGKEIAWLQEHSLVDTYEDDGNGELEYAELTGAGHERLANLTGRTVPKPERLLDRCTIRWQPDGAAIVMGSREDLLALMREIFDYARIRVDMIDSYTVDEVPQPGYPRIECHPSNAAQVLSAAARVELR